MESKSYKVLGVMSGTSHDGIDIAEIHLTHHPQQSWSYEIGHATTLPYPAHWQEILKEIDTYSKAKAKEIDKDYTAYLAKQIRTFIAQHPITELDAVCSHGHTVFHEPENKYTLQIGNLPKIASLIGEKVVCNFRVEDVQLGGQGAPLVPIGDRLLFPQYRGCVNLGGFANISIEKDKTRIAYDICAVNTVLNHYAQKCGKPFDKGGEIAKKGKVNSTLLNQLTNLPFYKLKAPKSLGIEWVKAIVFPILEKSGLSRETLIATYTRHVAEELARQFNGLKKGEILVTGGGAYNQFLMEETQRLTQNKLIIPEDTLVEYKEALIFGLLGVLKLREEINVLSSVTGAHKNHSAGFIYTP